MKRKLLAMGMAAALLGLALGCAEERIDDERQLDRLSSRELGELCGELLESWPSAERRFECVDGSSVSFAGPPELGCGQADLSECPVTAGTVRACARAIVDDPCGASFELPLACADLQQTGCVASVAPELATHCSTPMAVEIEAFEGIYELVSHTDNAVGCEAEGMSLLEDDAERFLVVVATEVFGAPLGALQSCADLSACRATGARIREQASAVGLPLVDDGTAPPELAHALVCKAETAAALSSQEVTVGPRGDGATCSLWLTDTSVARAADGSLHLESRTFAWEKPVDADGCSYRAGEKQASVPCAALSVREARFVSAL
jgi:hypothetical protein